MSRNAAIIFTIVVVLCLGVGSYLEYRKITQLEDRVDTLGIQVNQAKQVIQEEAAAISAASQQANQAASRAEIAAQARAAAEAQRVEAETGKAKAETAILEAAKTATEAQEQVEQMRHERQEELNRMFEALNRIVPTKRTSTGMVMVLPESTFKFAFDSADIDAKNRELLSRVAGVLLVSKGYGLSVFGYTDDVGSSDYNQKLSVRRADEVRKYLVQSGVNPTIINATGYGKSSPLVKDSTEEARAKNRRVEIALTDSSVKYTGMAPSPSPR